MEEKKEGGKKERKSLLKKHQLMATIIVTLIIIYAIVFLNQKINFFLGNELVVYLTPQQKSISMHYSNQSFVSFDTSIDNSANCNAKCEYTFYDRSRNIAIDNGDFKISKGEHIQRNYSLMAKRSGSGQDIYSFDLSCKSVASFVCLTSSPIRQRSSFITVNYYLSEQEKQLKNELKEKIVSLLLQLENTDEDYQRLSQRYFELAKRINLNELTDDKSLVEADLDSLILEMENIRSIWPMEDYGKIDLMLDDSFSGKIDDISDSIKSLNEKIDETMILHNFILDGLSLSSKKLEKPINISTILDKNDENDISILISNFNEMLNEVTNNSFSNYSFLQNFVNSIDSKSDSIISNSRFDALHIFNRMNYFVEYENRLLCIITNDCSVQNSLISGADSFISNYPDIDFKCNDIFSLNDKFSSIRSNYQNQNADIGQFYENKKIELNNTIILEFNTNLISNQDIKNSFNLIIPKNTINLTPINETQELKNSLLSKINFSSKDDFEDFKSSCKKTAPKISKFDFSPIKEDTQYSIIKKINTTLSDNPAICCVFSQCQPCCTNDVCKNENYPVIFLHGHSFASDNSPEFSLDAFNKIQAKMQEDGYINAGIVSLFNVNDQGYDGVWGLSGRPITVKASYYYDSISSPDGYLIIPTKSESIDTYAVRFKEIVELVKKRSGKDKVNIVAHSMGGLVARRYIQIFGDSSVNKLVMIATPNKGISGNTNSVCGIIGENLECRDMSKDSIFLSKLNDPMQQPKNTRVYNIIGTGCGTEQIPTDGVVPVSDVELSYANNFYVEGKCTGVIGNLHTEILDIDRFKTTYNVLRDILQE